MCDNRRKCIFHGVILCLLTIIYCLCITTVQAEAKSKSVVEKRIAQIRKEYSNKSKLNEIISVEGFNGGGCNALVMYTTLRIFHNCYTPDCDTYKTVGKGASTSDISAIKNLFSKGANI